ncbi:MAG: hypothetical protein ACK4TA_22240 [Saprospiraceae bacterium]
MKIFSLFLSALAALIVLPACVENDVNKDEKDRLVGFWKINRISGGITGSGYPADFTAVQFHPDGTYTILDNDDVVGEGTYALVKEQDKLILRILPNDPINLIFESPEKEIVFASDKLLIRDPCCDFYEYEFLKDIN